MSSSRVLAAWVALSTLFWVSGCGGDRSPTRTPGPALWITEASGELSPREFRSLSRRGVRDLFVEAGTLSWNGTDPSLERTPWIAVPERTPTTLVIRGRWPGTAPRPKKASAVLAPAFEELLGDARNQGFDATGLHLDLEVAAREEAVSAYAEFLERVGKEVPGRWSWSATVDSRLPGTERLASATDFVVEFVYGERPGRPGARPSWSFAEARTAADRLASYGRPYLIGIVTLGTARVGATGERVTETDLAQLAWDRDLEPGHGFTLEAGDRQHYRFEARRRTFVAGTAIAKGESVEVSGTSSLHVAELLQILREGAGEGYRGPLFYRLPGVGEGLSLAVEPLVHALEGPGATRPELAATVSGRKRGGRTWELAVTLREERGEPTELGFVDANWVDLALADEGVVQSVEPGNFYRYELLRRTGETLRRTLGRPDVVRLYAPYLPGHGELRSGPIRVRVPERPRVTVSGSFLAPYGRTLEVGPRTLEVGPGALVPRPPPEEGAVAEETDAGPE